MNTICKLADIDIYLFYYLDIKTNIKRSKYISAKTWI